MSKLLATAVAAVGLSLGLAADASAQTVTVNPATGQSVVQYYTPYTYGSTSFYQYPNTGYNYSQNYVGPTVYGPGYTANYPYMYNQYNYGQTRFSNPYTANYYGYSTNGYSGYGYPGYSTRTYRWWR